jgi:hypothetical protein
MTAQEPALEPGDTYSRSSVCEAWELHMYIPASRKSGAESTDVAQTAMPRHSTHQRVWVSPEVCPELLKWSLQFNFNKHNLSQKKVFLKESLPCAAPECLPS